MSSKKILFICGSLNQTRQMHKISLHLPEAECWFAPYYDDGWLAVAREWNLLEFSILGKSAAKRVFAYAKMFNLRIDEQGVGRPYDLVVTCSDLVVPRNIRNSKVILVQEGMTDPENFFYRLVKLFPFVPRWIASTSTTGLSDQYDLFCVASEGYRDLFIQKGVRPEKIVITGIPNFDSCMDLLINSFPLKHYVLVCTSDARETFKIHNRKRFIQRSLDIAAGRPLIFKLHPNEKVERAMKEIHAYAPGALVYAGGNTDEMIANCDVLITQFSTTVFVGLALGKECYSAFDLDDLRRLVPIQSGRAALDIADVCRSILKSGATNHETDRKWNSGCERDSEVTKSTDLIVHRGVA